MATAAMPMPAATTATGKSNRGKDQIQWSDDVWKALDQAVTDEMMRTRQVAKFLPLVYVEKKRTTVESDVVVIPPPPTAAQEAANVPFDASLSVDETQTNRIEEYFTTFRLSVAQVEAEEHQEAQMAASLPPAPAANGQGTMSRPHRAGTAISLALRCANVLAQAEDLILLNGQNAAVNAPLFTNQQVQSLVGQTNLQADLDFGLLNIQNVQGSITISQPAGSQQGPANVVMLPPGQVIPVHPVPATLTPGIPAFPPVYRENTLNAVADGVSALQELGHYENYALVLHTYPYADLHQALPTTLIEPVEPVSHLIKAGIYGTGTLPPFTPVTPPTTPPSPQPPATGLPTLIQTNPPGQPFTAATLGAAQITGFLNPTPSSGPAPPIPNVLYTGVLVSLSGNTMDQVRGLLDDSLDAMVTFNQKDQNEQYRFRVFQRHCLRLKDPTAVIVLLFLDS
jgi:hypothetical protein